MANVINDFLARTDVKTKRATSPADIDAVSHAFGMPMPEMLVKLWNASDGAKLGGKDAHLAGPKEVLKYLTWSGWKDILLTRGFLPFLDTHTSNYLVVTLREPLAWRVLWMPHDDSIRLVYRNLESCFADLSHLMEGDRLVESYLHDAQGDYAPDAPRPLEDQEAARELLRTENKNSEWNLAAQLLDASNLAEWATLLETEHFVRRDVRKRMKAMTSPAVQELLRIDETAFDEFANEVATAARKAGFWVGGRKENLLEIGTKGINLEGFFYRRHIPEAIPRIVLWIQDLRARRNPYDRPGNFSTD